MNTKQLIKQNTLRPLLFDDGYDDYTQHIVGITRQMTRTDDEPKQQKTKPQKPQRPQRPQRSQTQQFELMKNLPILQSDSPSKSSKLEKLVETNGEEDDEDSSIDGVTDKPEVKQNKASFTR